ncbi:MAG: hypothetical protein KJ709_07960 [Nanoarchaeota archaeon]|nr:hypothetical protein [Nanoarchaeota archaeon]
MKCQVCKQKIEETFLGKIEGTIVKNAKGKKFAVCKDCQRLGKKELLAKLPQ